MNKFTPSPQQCAVFDFVSSGVGNAVLIAVAGAGKTSTLIEALSLMKGSVFFGAFNKKIVEEISSKTKHLSHVNVSTFHAAGFRAWRAFAKNVKVESNKCKDIFDGAANKYPEYKPFRDVVLHLVSLAKQSGIGINKPIDDNAAWHEIINHYDLDCLDDGSQPENVVLVIKLARKVLQHSIQQDFELVDFDDMLYAPLVHNARIQKFDWVLIDEAQDTNETRRLLALQMLSKTGRLIAVGDPHQAIYGFTGADSDSLNLIKKSVNAVELPLTVTFRCPKSVVTHAQQWVSHIQSADNAPEGFVGEMSMDKVIESCVSGDAIICRNNAPLIELVYKLIGAGKAARVEGREIGNNLKALATRWKVKSFSALLEKLDLYFERESAKLTAKEQSNKIQAVEDKIRCLKVIIDRVINVKCTNPGQIVAQEIDKIFSDTENQSDVIVLSSIHRSKGREWTNVFWIQMPMSPWARQDWEQEQERNLCYVAATRAKSNLFLVQ